MTTPKTYIVLDVETTGVDAKADDIIEFAAVRLDAAGEETARLDFLVGTPQELSPTVIALTGIQPADLSGRPAIAEVMDTIREFIGASPIVGHNIGFDIEFLNAHGAELTNPVLDTLELAYTILPAQSYYSLEYLTHRFGFPHQPAHRAMADVLATVDLFKFLVGQASGLQPATRDLVNQLVPYGAWTWGWLIHQPLKWQMPKLAPALEENEDERLAREVHNIAPRVADIATAKTGSVNFIETHFDGDPDALALVYATLCPPAVVVVPDRLFYRTDWTQVGKMIDQTITPRYPRSLWYRPDAEVEWAKGQESLSASSAQLITKVIIWRREWAGDYSRLYLSRDEQYQWAQHLAPLEPGEELTDAILVTPAEGLLELDGLEERAVVTARPLLLEDAVFAAQTRTFSVNYLAAAVSSRRDFVHQYVRATDVRLADSLFKTLNHFSSDLQTITELLIQIYADYPPTSPYDRNIELTPEAMSDATLAAFRSATTHLEVYLNGIAGLAGPAASAQIERTRKLVNDLTAVAERADDRRYFLYAEGNRFFLELVPARADTGILRRLVERAREAIWLGPGLSVSGRFDYWTSRLGGEGKIIIGHDRKIELLVAQDLPEGSEYAYGVAELAKQALERGGKTLFMLHSAFEARQLFNELFPHARETDTTVESYDTVGNPARLSKLLQATPKFILIGHYYWFDRVWPSAGEFDRLILGKLPFEAISRPQSKVLSDTENGFETYTLARAVMRLKEVLHLAQRSGLPLSMLDSRLLTRDYGLRVLNSLAGFTVVPENTDQLLS